MGDHKWVTNREVALLEDGQKYETPTWDDVNRLLADREKVLPLILVAYLLLKNHFPNAEITAELFKVLEGTVSE